MRNLALIVLASASLMGMPSIASAQWYGGSYYYDDDPPPRYHRRHYRERYYDDDRYYRGRHYGERRGYREQPHYRTWNGCPHGYTVQDGRCKPYTGR